MITPLPEDFTRAELAEFINALALIGYLGLTLVILLLAVIAGRGK